MGSRQRRKIAAPKRAWLLRTAAGLAALILLVLWGHPAPAREPTPRDKALMRQCFALARASVAAFSAASYACSSGPTAALASVTALSRAGWALVASSRALMAAFRLASAAVSSACR